MEKIICSNCGGDNIPNSKYCSRCGKTLPKITSEISQQPTTETENKTDDNTNNIAGDLKAKIKFYILKYKWLIGLSIAVCFFQLFNKVLMPEILDTVVKTDTQNNANAQILNNKVDCDKSVAFGDIKICLPVIDGMIECYSNPYVKAKAVNFQTEGNTDLAYYLNTATYKQVSDINNIAFEDYFKIYVTDEAKGLKIGQSELNDVAKSIGGLFVQENWDELKPKLKKNYNYVSMGKPVLIESHMANNKIRTFVILSKMQTTKKETVQIEVINAIQIKERLICLAYYKNYDGEESVKEAKAKNDYIVLRLLDENK